MPAQFKICSCNRTVPFDDAAGATLGKALGCGALAISHELCRREIGSVLQALPGVDEVVIGCTQEQVLFEELAAQHQSGAPLRFVNLRETGGWSTQAAHALPKMAALLAEAALAVPEPVPAVSFNSGGSVLVIGPAGRALPWARRLRQQLQVSVLLTATGAAEAVSQQRSFPVFSGERVQVAGWLGAFDVRWRQANPIDLEACVRCNACVDACPEGAIDFSYQVDAGKCTAQRACVQACGAIGAIDFSRNDTERGGRYDLIFDLADTPAIRLHEPPQGYFAPGADPQRQCDAAFELAGLVGEFEKPKFFEFRDKLCAHGRNGKTGCSACLDACSAEAIRHDGDKVAVVPQLCVGCGTCSTVCPSGAMRYAYPRVTDLGLRVKTMLNAYAAADGIAPALLLYGGERGAELIAQLGRLGKAGGTGVPARVIPLALHQVTAAGLDLWLAALAYGAANVALLTTSREAAHEKAALELQAEIGQAIVSGLGYGGRHLQVIDAAHAAELESALNAMPPAQAPRERASFNVAAEKRGTLDLALSHLSKFAPHPAAEIALPAGAPYGAVEVDRASCTLCMACVGACPASALLDNPDLPQLRFIERNCVQCGLCSATCPEHAISLKPRLVLSEAAGKPMVLSEAQPYHCIRCGKPFGALPIVENMLAKLAGHGAFAGHAERLRMCADCRVVDMLENPDETSITDRTPSRR